MSDQLLPDIIQPEGLRIADTYIECGSDSKKTAAVLCMPIEEVTTMLAKPEVKSYLSGIFNEVGFRNKDRMFSLMDELINRKLEEMEETGMGTEYDIMDVLKTYHRMKMDEKKMDIEHEKAKSTTPGKQTNVQINGLGDENYASLLEKLVG